MVAWATWNLIFRSFLATTFTSAFLSYFCQRYWDLNDATLRSIGMSSLGVQTIDLLFYGIDAFVVFCIIGTLISGAMLMTNSNV